MTELVNRSAAISNLEYQRAMYRAEPKESDKVILELLSGKRGRLLDIGCSNGNLLKHIKGRYGFDLHGGDISSLRIQTCAQDPELAGIDFQVMDVMDLPPESFDVIVANAVLCMLDKRQYAIAAKSISAALRPGGSLITFDWLHTADQNLAITEVTDEIPEGVKLYFRSFKWTREILSGAGFCDINFHPFNIPIDLPLDHTSAIRTHTTKMADGGRLQFRGVLLQPWCHLTASIHRGC